MIALALLSGCSLVAGFSEFETRTETDSGPRIDGSAGDADVPLNDAGPAIDTGPEIDAGPENLERCNRVDDDGDGGIDEGLMRVGDVETVAGSCGNPDRIRIATDGTSYAVAYVEVGGLLAVKKPDMPAYTGPLTTILSDLSGNDGEYWLAYRDDSSTPPGRFAQIPAMPQTLGDTAFAALDVAAVSGTDAWAGVVANDGAIALYRLMRDSARAEPSPMPATMASDIALARRTSASVEVAFTGTSAGTTGVFHAASGGGAPSLVAPGNVDRVLVTVLDDVVFIVYGPTPMGDWLNVAGADATSYGGDRRARALANDGTTAAVLVTEENLGLVFRVNQTEDGTRMEPEIELAADVEWRDLVGVPNGTRVRFVAAGSRSLELVAQEISCSDPP